MVVKGGFRIMFLFILFQKHASCLIYDSRAFETDDGAGVCISTYVL